MLCSTDASLRHVSSAISSTLSNFGGFIFCMSSRRIITRLPVSANSTSTSSPCSRLILAATKPCKTEEKAEEEEKMSVKIIEYQTFIVNSF